MIKAIGSTGDLYSAYNRIQSRQQPVEATALNDAASVKQSGQAIEKNFADAPELNLRFDSLASRSNAPLENISLSFADNGSFEMKGRDADIDSLDVKKAVSAMQMDEALMQYQYFVGESNPFMSSEDGIVIAK